MGRQNAEKKEMISSTVVAVDKDKGSQYALKYAVENLLTKGQSVTLLHVKQKSASIPNSLGSQLAKGDGDDEVSSQGKEIFVPFRCFCTRKEINCREVLLEDADIARALVDYVASNLVETLLLGSSSRGLVKKFRSIVDIPTSVSKSAPEFCTVYVITKGKIASVRSATCPLPEKHSLQHALLHNSSNVPDVIMESPFPRPNQTPRGDGPAYAQRVMQEEIEIKSPFLRTKNGSLAKPCEPSIPDTDKSSVSSGRPSTDRMFPSFCDSSESGMTPRLSISSDFDNKSFGSSYSGNKSIDMNLQHNFSSSSQESGKMSCSSSNNLDELETEMRRLKLELKQTMEMYSSACKEALTAKQKARELQLWKLEEQQRLEEARLSEEAALQLVEREKAKSKAAIEALEAAQRIAELEAQKRKNAEMKALKEAEERKKLQLLQNDIRYRRYTIEEIELAADDFSDSLKIGEGGYGPVYRGYLDHTPVAIKVLRPDAAQGRSQFQQEVEVLSRIRHPNMVILLGACPEFGCLVYEYMACGSLEDRLMRRGNTPPLSWQVRFRIAAEIATALLFLHQTKPEPLVHRDLKPGNILLDRNYVSKISDVGLARLVPPSVANNVTQYRMTATAGTFCYIDPEYQQTGMLGIKSDVYSLGIMLLQIITSKPPMGLAHSVERAIEKGTFADMLDPLVPDWPMEEALRFAKLAVQCAELRRKDRPDLGKNVLPELNRLRTLAEANLPNPMFDVGGTALSPHNYGHTSTLQDMMSDQQSGYDSSRSPSSTSSSYGGRW